MDEFGPIDDDDVDVNPDVAMDDEEVAGLLDEDGSSHDDGFKTVSYKAQPKLKAKPNTQPNPNPHPQPKTQPKPQPPAKPLSP
jgi:hypothetical protein